MLVFFIENVYYCRGSTAINYNIGRFKDLDGQISNKHKRNRCVFSITLLTCLFLNIYIHIFIQRQNKINKLRHFKL